MALSLLSILTGSLAPPNSAQLQFAWTASAGTNRRTYVFVERGNDNGPTITGSQYLGASPLTEVFQAYQGSVAFNPQNSAGCWYIDNASSGLFSFNIGRTDAEQAWQVLEYSGVDTTVAPTSSVYIQGNIDILSSSMPNVTVDDISLGMFSSMWLDGPGTRTFGAGQTQQWNYDSNTTSGLAIGGSTKTGVGTVSQTWGETSIFRYGLCASIVVKAAGTVSTASASFDAATARSSSLGASTLTYSHTVGASANRLFVQVAAYNDNIARTVSGVTYAGVNMSRYGGSGWTDFVGFNDVWTLENPTTGANNVIVTLDGALVGTQSIKSAARSFNNVTTMSLLVSGSGNSTTPSISIPSVLGEDLVADFLFNSSGNSNTVGASPQSQSYNLVGDPSIAGSIESGSGTISPSWTLSPVAGTWRDLGLRLLRNSYPAPPGPINWTMALHTHTANTPTMFYIGLSDPVTTGDVMIIWIGEEAWG